MQACSALGQPVLEHPQTDPAQAPATSQTLQLPDAAARSSVKRAEYLEGRLAQDDHAKGGRELTPACDAVHNIHGLHCNLTSMAHAHVSLVRGPKVLPVVLYYLITLDKNSCTRMP